MIKQVLIGAKSIKPKENPEDIYGIIPKSRADQYDMHEIIKTIS